MAQYPIQNEKNTIRTALITNDANKL